MNEDYNLNYELEKAIDSNRSDKELKNLVLLGADKEILLKKERLIPYIELKLTEIVNDGTKKLKLNFKESIEVIKQGVERGAAICQCIKKSSLFGFTWQNRIREMYNYQLLRGMPHGIA